MTWKSITEDERKLISQYQLWVRTVRNSARFYVGKDNYQNTYSKFVPSSVDVIKSALFERIRSGLDPLPEPPPTGYSCPWYALIEDPGPHWEIENNTIFQTPTELKPITKDDCWAIEEGIVTVYQSSFKILQWLDKHTLIAKDGLRDTSYRFLVWWEPDNWWEPPSLSKIQPRYKRTFIVNLKFKEQELKEKYNGKVEHYFGK